MKKLFFILIATFMSLSVFSQIGQSVKQLSVKKSTPCTQHFVAFRGDYCDRKNCHPTTATWYPDICGGTAKLVFN